MSGAPSFPGIDGVVPPKRRRRRGLFDFLLLVALGYGVYAKTPVGAVVETGIRVARGQKDHPSWLATFRGRDISSAASPEAAQAVKDLDRLSQNTLPAKLAAAAARHNVDVDALAAVMSVRGQCDDTVCAGKAPDKLSMFVPGATGDVDVDVFAAGLRGALDALATKDHSLALEALFVGQPALKLALDQAERSALEAPNDVEVHAPFFSPATRRGPLQGALSVLLVHRLRTLAWPADSRYRITSPFGERIHPVTGKVSFHNGTDIGTPTGTPLVAAAGGVVKRRSVDSTSGNYVILDLGLGIQTTYCHMSEVAVNERERLQTKDLVGKAGATGRVTGPHLHYILRIADKAVDAERFGKTPTASGAMIPVPEPPPVEPPPTGTGKRKGTKPTTTTTTATKPAPPPATTPSPETTTTPAPATTTPAPAPAPEAIAPAPVTPPAPETPPPPAAEAPSPPPPSSPPPGAAADQAE
jgi:murein DD-endopeptidase MepM/ murein hydrolase activator NlpD